MVKPENFIEGPVPGQSLTATPRQYKWERSPQMSDYEEVTKFYINKLADQDVMDDLAVLFEGGMPITPFVQALTTTGVSEGLHTIDVSLIVGPVVHAFIKASMLQYGIDAKDDTFNPDKDPNEREKRRLITAIQLALADAESADRTADMDSGVAVLEELQRSLSDEVPEDTMKQEETVAPQDDMPVPPKGLMARETI